ncbi:protein O-mannosyl-transferase family [Mucilaginibacter ximonensis]|uniref:Protein O-mannosyl-transferase family n=1 Tax=Mucilaginibacter ximonensis TaxID=538021 RepID=A0ABW5Y6N2_9SPHI
MKYNRINNLFGWLAFIVASVTYILTLEQSASFWDCGEFIACIYRLQVAHQPGAPLFTMIGKVFSLLSMGNVTKVAYWTNIASALASGATILFLFWTITALAKKILVKKEEDLHLTNIVLIIGSGLVGALAYAFSDTFWFSAVESEVYAQSSLCTAIVFWAILKWDAHADEPNANRWIVFIAYVMGLSIGIHLLNLLVIPAIALVIYFRKSDKINTWGTIKAFFIGVIILAAVLWGIIQYTVKGAAYSDLFFVNTLGMGFGSGAIVFFLLLFGTIILGIVYTFNPAKNTIIAAASCFVAMLSVSAGITGFIAAVAIVAMLEYGFKIRERRFALNSFLVCTAFILFGYSTFVMIVIRAKAGTNLNNSNPQDAFALNGYLNRDQYGDTPLLYGNFFDAQAVDQTEGGNIYRKGDTKYEIAGKKVNTVYDHNTIFPRMFSQKAGHEQFYRQWEHLGDHEAPTFANNLSFFLSWQVNQMYTRYFLWNFVGRANEMDGQIKGIDGDWISGWNFKKPLPYAVTKSKSYNRLFFLPLILGLLGVYFHFKKNQRDAGVVAVLFFFTGIAILLYLNQDPLQPRERDYAYAGSFYAFAIWIGLAVICIADLLSRKEKKLNAAILSTVVCLSVGPILMANQEWDDHDRSTKMTPHDMAYNYLNSCAKDAILFTYGDNDTYPLWYIQEVEGVRPDVRIVNLSLLGTDWYIKQMTQKMNESAPVPITMDYSKYKLGTRDMIPYNDAKVPGALELKDVFDFIVSDNKEAQAQLQDGSSTNYLPTRNLKITINPDEVIKTGTVPADQKDKIASELDFTYGSNMVLKDNLAIMDIIAHNNWKRPIYFTVTAPPDNMLGLTNYMYNEGFAYRLLPLKPDTTMNKNVMQTGAIESTNSLVMYNNMMSKFKWGNFKTAQYLDHESLTQFYPLIARLTMGLTDNLIKEGHPDLAKNLLNKFNDVMPDGIPVQEIAVRKYYMAEDEYKLGMTAMAEKTVKQLEDYLTNSLDYNYTLVKDGQANQNEVQFGISLLNGLVQLTKEKNNLTLSNAYKAKLDQYIKEFNINMGN